MTLQVIMHISNKQCISLDNSTVSVTDVSRQTEAKSAVQLHPNSPVAHLDFFTTWRAPVGCNFISLYIREWLEMCHYSGAHTDCGCKNVTFLFSFFFFAPSQKTV